MSARPYPRNQPVSRRLDTLTTMNVVKCENRSSGVDSDPLPLLVVILFRGRNQVFSVRRKMLEPFVKRSYLTPQVRDALSFWQDRPLCQAWRSDDGALAHLAETKRPVGSAPERVQGMDSYPRYRKPSTRTKDGQPGRIVITMVRLLLKRVRDSGLVLRRAFIGRSPEGAFVGRNGLRYPEMPIDSHSRLAEGRFIGHSD